MHDGSSSRGPLPHRRHHCHCPHLPHSAMPAITPLCNSPRKMDCKKGTSGRGAVLTLSSGFTVVVEKLHSSVLPIFHLSDQGQLLHLIKSIFTRKKAQDLTPVREAPIHSVTRQKGGHVAIASPNQSKHESATGVQLTVLVPQPRGAGNRKSC